MEDFLVVAKKKIPNLIGLKFASKDLGDMIGCLFAGKFNILCGCDEVNFSTKHCMLLYFEISTSEFHLFCRNFSMFIHVYEINISCNM